MTHGKKDKECKLVGRAGEDLAAGFLRGNGLRILEQNYSVRIGELDIIALDGDTICFVEVKTRRSLAYGVGLESVGKNKQRKISRVALFYLQDKGWLERSARFDIISILLSTQVAPQFDWLKNAFESCC